MYLITAYFDDDLTNSLEQLKHVVEKASGNYWMTEHKVPMHLTVASFDVEDESVAKEVFQSVAARVKQEEVLLASIGLFEHSVFASAVLTEGVQRMADVCFEELSRLDEVVISKKYRPFRWMPHVTIGKHMTEEEMVCAVRGLVKEFHMMKGQIVRVGLAGSKPYKELAMIEL